jgi:hypothetical protein
MNPCTHNCTNEKSNNNIYEHLRFQIIQERQNYCSIIDYWGYCYVEDKISINNKLSNFEQDFGINYSQLCQLCTYI